MNTKNCCKGDTIKLDNRSNIDQQSSNVNDLQNYFSKNMSLINQYGKTNKLIDKQTFANILQSSGLPMNNACLESLWNLCQPSGASISYSTFVQQFAPFQLAKGQDITLPANQCRILNYITRLSQTIKTTCWENLKDEFCSLDRYGRLFVTIDQALNLMKKYCFPLNDKQQRELAILFSPKNNGQFNYFDFMQYFIDRSSLTNTNQNLFSRSTYMIQSKQSWTLQPVTIISLFNRIRLQAMRNYENIYRMFKIFDKTRQAYLTKKQFIQLLKKFDIDLNDEELYHVMCEIDKNQDERITYNELYDSLITDFLQL